MKLQSRSWPVCFIIFGTLVLSCTTAIAQPPPISGKERQLTFGEGPDQSPTWNPRGTLIAFHSPRSDNYDIWTVPAQGGEPKQLTASAADEMFPAWSPDGKQIAFIPFTDVRRDRGNLFLIDADGTRIQQITQDNTFKLSPKWSKDGQALIYAELSGSPSEFVVGIIELNINTKKRRTIVSDYLGSVTVSPDGRMIAFDSPDASKQKRFLFVTAVHDAKVTPIVTDMNRAWFPDWSPDGEWIAFQSGKQEDATIWLVTPDGTHKRALAVQGRHPSWSPDGKKIALTKGTYESANIWIFQFQEPLQ